MEVLLSTEILLFLTGEFFVWIFLLIPPWNFELYDSEPEKKNMYNGVT